MLFFRSLLLLVALLSPAFGQDGAQIAAGAKDAAQDLRIYLDGIAKAGERPDYTKPPALDLFHRVFDIERLAASPPAKASDLTWLIEWLSAANQTSKQIIYFDIKPGPNPDQAATLRNLTDYEDQYAAATNFMLRVAAREATAMLLFMDQLAPEQRTPVREAGLQKSRNGAAGLIASAIGSVFVGVRPANARLMTAAMRDTRDVWASYILPDDRTQIINLLTRAANMAKDEEVKKNLTAFNAALAAAK